MEEKNGKTRSSESSCVSLDYCNYVTTNNKLVNSQNHEICCNCKKIRKNSENSGHNVNK